MRILEIPLKHDRSILALGAESAGNFSFYQNGKIFHSEDFGDLLEDGNFKAYSRKLKEFLKKEGLKPAVVACDMHPFFKTTELAQSLAKRYGADLVPIQHHMAHIFSAVGDRLIQNPKLKIPDSFHGIACDGTGLGFDGKIWGGEIFKIQVLEKNKIQRVSHLENQILLGGEMAIREPARMLISILGKFLDKEAVFAQVKKYYSKNDFELLWNQYRQNFNCLETSSTGRVLDAVSILLGFVGNKRGYKHEAIDLLETNSGKPYADLKPKIVKKIESESGVTNYELCTTYLFEYLIKNIKKDRKRLAATAQLYIAQGLGEILNLIHDSRLIIHGSFFAGGVANNKIISSYLESKGIYINNKIPRGDAGISFGQILYCLSADSWN